MTAVSDKGVHQSDSFAKYAAAFFSISLVSNPFQFFLKSPDLRLGIGLCFNG